MTTQTQTLGPIIQRPARPPQPSRLPSVREVLGLVVLVLVVYWGYSLAPAAPDNAEAQVQAEAEMIADPRSDPAYRAMVDFYIREAAARYGVSESLVRAVVEVESQFDPRAVSRKGALGLMQLMPVTASNHGVRDPFDPRENIDGGVRELRRLMRRFDRNLPLVLAAYNAGETAVRRYRGVPPYRETRQYITRVIRHMKRDLNDIARTSS
ncbi:MAG: lytic transglycosylase domain-containing protein [Candidatus Rokuibacteriota bacterium]